MEISHDSYRDARAPARKVGSQVSSNSGAAHPGNDHFSAVLPFFRELRLPGFAPCLTALSGHALEPPAQTRGVKLFVTRLIV